MLITETMSRHNQLSMDSYDRLFPSQDVMPSGGFGNLIAFPLQSILRQQGKTPLLLTERKDHLRILKDLLEPHVTNLIVLSGGMKAKEQKSSMAKLASLSPEEPRLVLAVGRYIGEGFDDPRLDTLFLARPFSWRGTLVQFTGRLHREHEGKLETQVYDYVDGLISMLARMAEKRRTGMRGMGYHEARRE